MHQFTSSQLEEIAKSFFGEPNRALSSKHELRFGSHGSVSVHLQKLVYFDHERGSGGDTFTMVKNLTGNTDRDTFAWLEARGYKDTDISIHNGSGGDIPYDATSDPFKNVVFKNTVPRQFRIVKTWPYTDENGEELFEVCRIEDGTTKDGEPIKTYRQRHKEAGEYIDSVKGIRQVPYRLPELIDAISQGKLIFIAEGEKCVDAVIAIGGAATCNAMGAGKWPDGIVPFFRGADIVILPDNDEAGRKHRDLVATKLYGVAKRVRVLELPGLPDKGDIADWIAAGGTIEKLLGLVENNSAAAQGKKDSEWPEPNPLPDGLLPVMEFDPDFLPDSIAPWVMDIADRMQCPPDFVGIPAVVALGAIIGRKVSVRPQRKTDWHEVPNLWGCIVGRPGVLKSPAMAEALNPLHRLEIKARETGEAEKKDYDNAMEIYKLQRKEANKKVRKSIAGGRIDASHLAISAPGEPKAKRYITNDVSYEKLGEILAANPNGVLAYRDELISLLKTLDREEYISARGFYLSAWSGKSGYTFDRIIRGQTYIKAACVSMLGSTQPGRLVEYMLAANEGNAGDDGLIQRFGLLVWPDQSPEGREADRYPRSEPRSTAWKAFERLATLTPEAAAAQFDDEFERLPFLRFDEPAQVIFSEWRSRFEYRLRSGDLTPAVESHLVH